MIYSLVVVGEGEERGLIRINSVLGIPPMLTGRAAPTHVSAPGASVRLWADAEADPAPTFRWFRDDTVLEDVTGGELIIPNFDTETHAGVYEVEITNILGAVVVETFVLAPPLAIRSIDVARDGSIRFEVEGAIGAAHELQATTDFKTWISLATLIPEGLQAGHVGTTDGAVQFYRVMEKR